MTLLALADRETPAFRRAFQYALASAVTAVSDQELEDAFATGTPANALASIPWLGFMSAFVQHIEPAYRALFVAAGRRSFTKAVGFSPASPRAAQWILAHSGNMVRGITEESKQAIRQQVLAMFERGLTPAQAAKEIRQYIGLTQRDAGALWRMQAQFQEQFAAGKISARQLVQRVERYRSQLLARRASLIARTEALKAANQGQIEAWRQAVEQGQLNPEAKREWLVTDDERLCNICAPVPARGPVRLTQPFILGNGEAIQAPPAHPACRCTLALVPD